MFSLLFVSVAQAGFGLSMDASQHTFSGQETSNDIVLNSTIDFRTKDYLLQFEALDFVHSLAIEDQLRGGVNGYVNMGRQQINSDWNGSIQLGLHVDAHNYVLDSQSVTDIGVAFAPRMGIELYRKDSGREKQYRNTISGGLYLSPSIGVIQRHELSDRNINKNYEISVGSQLQLSIWLD